MTTTKRHPMLDMELEAERLRTCWIVRPVNQLGTCGFSPAAWSAIPVPFGYAPTADHAVQRARRMMELEI
jgi:hypothetical protein